MVESGAGGARSSGDVVDGALEWDVYVSYPHREVDWAQRLDEELSERGLRSFVDLNVRPGEPWKDTLDRALEHSRILVVLWSEAAREAPGMLTEVMDFQSRMLQGEQLRIVPVMLGGQALISSAPEVLASRQALLVDAKDYEAGPYAEVPSWTNAIEQIAKIAEGTRRGPRRAQERQAASTERISPESAQASSFEDRWVLDVGEWASTALNCAAGMLVSIDPDEPQMRAAALIGALSTSVARNMAPSTGDVAMLVGNSQRDGRGLPDALGEAARVAGLAPPRVPAAATPASREVWLGESSVAWILQQATAVQRQTGAQQIHLRHVMAVGVHPSVPSAVFEELGLTFSQLRLGWHAAIARMPRVESGEGWEAILREQQLPLVESPSAPSAHVHADKWTTEDSLDYALYAKAIAEFITHKSAKPPMVISVQAPWGQGKTSLMRMVQKNLDPEHPDLVAASARREASVALEKPSELTFKDLRKWLGGKAKIEEVKPNSIRTVWFNAWKYQSSEQTWAGLAHAILAQLPARLSRKDRELFWLRLQRRRIDPSAVREDIHRAALERFLPQLVRWPLLAVGGLFVVGIALLAHGLGVVGAGVAGTSTIGSAWLAWQAWTKATDQALKRPLEGAYLRYVRQPDYSGNLGYLHLVEEDMANALELLTPDAQPTVIFIDDLDRCSPGKIGEVIEAVNLFLAGEFPNCAFVIGIDAEVVAASMEVVHAQIIDKLGDRRGELGWRFMDKFVQLPFVIPRLQVAQREGYMRGLFARAAGEQSAQPLVEADRLEAQVTDQALSVDQLAARAGELRQRLVAVDPDRARDLGEKVVEEGARRFSDEDPEVIDALAAQMQYLSDNPRTIKRAVNLYRFHRFAAIARQASALEFATPAQIGRWIVVIVRWPQFVRWLQAGREQGPAEYDGRAVAFEAGRDPAAEVLARAAKAESVRELRRVLEEMGVDAAWTRDTELLEFIQEPIDPQLRLELASSRGLW
jgi:KAP family P-loop domain/TIR domain